MLSWWVPKAPFAVFLAKAMQAFFFFFSDYNKYIFANHSLDTQMGKQGSKVSLRHRGVSGGGKQEVVPSVFTHSSKDNPLRECQGLSVLLN